MYVKARHAFLALIVLMLKSLPAMGWNIKLPSWRQLRSVAQGAATPYILSILGQNIGGTVDKPQVGWLIGCAAGIALDYWFLGGKNDPHTVWRKAGYFQVAGGAHGAALGFLYMTYKNKNYNSKDEKGSTIPPKIKPGLSDEQTKEAHSNLQ